MRAIVPLKFSLMVPHDQLDACIALFEDGLRCVAPTPYHQVLGRDFLHHTKALGEWIVGFYRQVEAAGEVKVGALYLEMNGFTINPDEWHCNISGYKRAGDRWDLEWLGEPDVAKRSHFVLTGMEPVQQAFADLFLDDSQTLGVKIAEELAEHLVTARFMQVVAAAHKRAKEHCEALRGLPVLSAAHDWSTVHQTS